MATENEAKEIAHPLLDQSVSNDRKSSLKRLFSSYDATTPRKRVHRKDSMKDLKLRIIHGPLHSTIKPAMCCLCCKDTMGELSAEERVIILTCGFIRECFHNEIPPDIIDLCAFYVGSSKEFEYKVLKSFAENRQEPRVECLQGCQNCCTDCFKECCSCEMFFDDCCCYCWIDMTDNCMTRCCKCWSIFECFTYYSCCFGYCGDFMLTLLMLISILITFGKDIAAFLLVNNYLNCNITGGSDYVNFNVYDWILIGSIADTGLWITIICFFISFWIYERECGKNCSEQVPLAFVSFVGCLWCFFIAWIVIGFLLYSEMISDDEINDECCDIIISWNILQIIPSIVIICFAVIICADESACGKCCGKGIDCFWDNTERFFDCTTALCLRRCGRIGVRMLHGLAVVMLFAFIIGKDISALVINIINDCDVIDEGKYVKSFGVTEWVYIASGCHMAIWIVFACWWGCGFCMAVESMMYIIAGVIFSICGFLFNVAWTVIGFLFYTQMTLDTRSGLECSNMVLSWNVLQTVETLLVILFFCGVVRA